MLMSPNQPPPPDQLVSGGLRLSPAGRLSRFILNPAGLRRYSSFNSLIETTGHLLHGSYPNNTPPDKPNGDLHISMATTLPHSINTMATSLHTTPPTPPSPPPPPLHRLMTASMELDRPHEVHRHYNGHMVSDVTAMDGISIVVIIAA
ncbi:hypothetical protein LSH36_396g02004 [Paralvinella palmiformis]|uniref:Uncharacterized protein n=1 Tax=Paralvinella palmiformis TaxID=53620 RepID=A0AAD9JD33_9ANNE|nr:hypothetical protein LSH36_396g02004 [Paralvinella palmiformis]